MNCPVCDREIVDPQATVCPYCIAPLPTPPPMPTPPTDNVFGRFDQPASTSVFGGQPPPPPDQQPEVSPFGPPPEEPSRVKKVGRAGMGIGLRIGIVVVVLAAGGFTQVYRSITGAGDFTTIEDVEVGECFNLFDEASAADEIVEIGSADVLPCTDEHDYELIAIANFLGVDTYSDSLFDTGWDNCLVLAESYLDFETIPDELSLDVLIPTSAAFGAGERGYRCYVFLEGQTPMTNSWRK